MTNNDKDNWKKEMALQIVKEDGRRYSILSSYLKLDRDIFLTAIKNGYRPADFAEELPKSLLFYKSVIMMLLQDGKNVDFVIQHAPDIMLHDKDVAILLMLSTEEPFKYFSMIPSEFHNTQFVDEVLEHAPSLACRMNYASDDVKELYNICKNKEINYTYYNKKKLIPTGRILSSI